MNPEEAELGHKEEELKSSLGQALMEFPTFDVDEGTPEQVE